MRGHIETNVEAQLAWRFLTADGLPRPCMAGSAPLAERLATYSLVRKGKKLQSTGDLQRSVWHIIHSLKRVNARAVAGKLRSSNSIEGTVVTALRAFRPTCRND